MVFPTGAWREEVHPLAKLMRVQRNHNAQYSLLKMIANWTKQLDNGEKVGVIFMDLSKAFDTINHSLLLAKLKAYGFSNQALLPLQQISEKHN